jgi:hypothetical protein
MFEALNPSDQQNPRRLIRRIEMDTLPQLSTTPLLKQKLNLDNLEIKIIGLKFESQEEGRAKITERVEKRWQQPGNKKK